MHFTKILVHALCNSLRPFDVGVGDNDTQGTIGSECFDETTTDSTRTTRDYDDFANKFHLAGPELDHGQSLAYGYVRTPMDFEYPPEIHAFRREVRSWFDQNLTDEFRALGTSSEFHERDWPTRIGWEATMGRGGWIGLSWPREFGGREASAMQELVFAEEYARSGAPTRAGTFGEGLLGPTLIHFGTDAQK